MGKKSAGQIRESLLKQLKDRGANVPHFENLIDDYCYYEAQEKKMQADVKRRGLIYETMSAQGKKIEKENPSVRAAYMYNKQKLAILRDLELTTKTAVNTDNDEL